MPKEFYSEIDIEDLVNRGITSLVVTDDVVLTDLAWEKAKKLGLELIQEDEAQPSAPVRPYMGNKNINPAGPSKSPGQRNEIKKKVRQAVIARLGKDIDAELLDSVIDRILNDQTNC
jgi:hypothetical protein